MARFWTKGGKRVVRTVPTKEEAEAQLYLWRDTEKRITIDTSSVAVLLDDFLANGTRNGWRPATVASYEGVIRLHLKPHIGRIAIHDLAIRDVTKMMAGLLDSGLSPRYVAEIRGVLRAALNYAIEEERVERNVAEKARPPRIERREQKALTSDQVRTLFAALDGERLQPLIVTITSLGLRRGEALALRWADIDLDRATVTIRRTGKRIAGEYIENAPKSEKSRRSIVLPSPVVTALRQQRVAIAEERLKAGPMWTDEDRVFPAEDGGPLGATSIRKALDRGLQRAELPRIRIHDLRHSAASVALMAGASLRDVQEMLGHSSYSLTADLYTHVSDVARKATASKMEQALWG